MKQLAVRHPAGEKEGAPSTLEEIERAQKDFLEGGLGMVKVKTKSK